MFTGILLAGHSFPDRLCSLSRGSGYPDALLKRPDGCGRSPLGRLYGDLIFRSSLSQQLTATTTLACAASQCKYLGSSLFHGRFNRFQRKSAVAKSAAACQMEQVSVFSLPDDELEPKGGLLKPFTVRNLLTSTLAGILASYYYKPPHMTTGLRW